MIGKQIAYYRKQNKMTQETLANMLSVSNQAVSKWESDQCCPDIQLIPEIARIFKISIDCLFGKEYSADSKIPWEDDGKIRVVVFKGRKLQKYKDCSKIRSKINFEYQGNAENIESALSVSCYDVSGNITAGTYITCTSVSGSVCSGTYVKCNDIGGNVNAGTKVDCNNIQGNVNAGLQMKCASVNGKIFDKEIKD